MMHDNLIKPHGGILINRFNTFKNINHLIKSKKSADYVLDENQYITCLRIADGSYSPLRGFMTKNESESVINKNRLDSEIQWPIPILLPSAKCTDLKNDTEIIKFYYPENNFIGILEVEDVFELNEENTFKGIFTTTDIKHPGVGKMVNEGLRFIGGDIYIFKKEADPFDEFCFTPEETRHMIKEKKWKTVAGFQTRNVPHRAHEYLQRIAMEVMDGLLIQPILGWKKAGDYNPELIIEAYNKFIELYYNKNQVLLSGLRANMFYAGPLEAVLHAIIRKNYGCNYFIVGRDHAGVGNYYEKYAAHKIFEKFEDIGIKPLKLNGPHYCKKCELVVSDKICNHNEEFVEEISGTRMRKYFLEKKIPPEFYMRKDISELIINHREPFIK